MRTLIRVIVVLAVVVWIIRTDSLIGNIVLAVAVGVVIMRVGMKMLGSFSAPMGEPPPPGELRKVKIVYQCEMCGSEVRMTSAPFSDPEPPRHCMDEMTLVSKSDVGQP